MSRATWPARDGNHSKVLKHRDGFQWDGVAPAPYKGDGDGWRGITRRVLVGETGESACFHVRYFELEPGGFSTLERHRHEHVVIPIRGSGEAQIGCRVFPLAFGDVVYVAPDDAHQFRNPSGAPFGFLCMVAAQRDRPRPADSPGVCEICE